MDTMNTQTETQHEKSMDTYINENSMEAFYSNSVILVTGATGFLGKPLLAKLLRTFPHLGTIFVLIRPKRNQTIEQRFKILLESTCFDPIRAENPLALGKIHPINGDVTLPKFGLSPDDRRMLQERVNIVFHSAATVKFNEPLKVAIELNTIGTDHMIELCKSMKNLVSVIHVSTAYSNPDRVEVSETIYTTKLKPSTVIDMCYSLDEDTLNVLEKKILGKHPNTYTFTKNLAEQIIFAKCKDMPLAIVRPSIITATEKEPCPGWVDTFTGITGFITEISRGVLRTAPCNPNLRMDLVPLDYVVDTVICASWHSTMQQSDVIKIYNCTSNAVPIRWDTMNKYVNKFSIKSPSKYMMWYPGCLFLNNKLSFLLWYILHVFPAIIGDFFLLILGNKPMLMKQAKRCEVMCKIGKFFATNEWTFHRSNMDDLAEKVKMLKNHDNFNVDIRHLNWETYFQNYLLGIQKHIFKESAESSKRAQSRLLVLYWVHRLTQVSSVIILLTMILRIGFWRF